MTKPKQKLKYHKVMTVPYQQYANVCRAFGTAISMLEMASNFIVDEQAKMKIGEYLHMLQERVKEANK